MGAIDRRMPTEATKPFNRNNNGTCCAIEEKEVFGFEPQEPVCSLTAPKRTVNGEQNEAAGHFRAGVPKNVEFDSGIQGTQN
jgi:hypothetical protein